MTRLHGLLREARVEGLVVLADSSRDCDLAGFVGSVHLGASFLLATADGATLGFVVDMERDEAAASGLPLLGPAELGVSELREGSASPGEFWHGVLAAAFARLGLAPGRWALAGHAASGTAVEVCSRMAAAGWEWVSGSEIVRRWRKCKPESQLPRLERPAQGVCAAMKAVAALLADADEVSGELRLDGAPLRVGTLRERVSGELASRGLSEPEGNIMAAGAAAGVPHTRGDSTHVLRVGEPIVVDLFPRGDVFADCTRTFCVGEPSEAFSRAYDVVLEALERAHDRCRPGGRGWDLQAATCDLFESAGYATLRSNPETRRGYVHGLGHGVGYELHEYPSFREAAGDEGLLEIGDLLTLEPGLYDPGAGYGVRLEDLCYMGPEGLVNLTPLPYDWDPRAWGD